MSVKIRYTIHRVSPGTSDAVAFWRDEDGKPLDWTHDEIPSYLPISLPSVIKKLITKDPETSFTVLTCASRQEG